MASERVVDNLNGALHRIFEEDSKVFLIGEDLLDPYGGAFKVSKGLSTKFSDRVISTPISESGIVALANGLALCGEKPIVEIMFGDFILLALDQIVNFAAKSPGMFGELTPHHLIVRCPVGGNRGYGATHSQSLQKHLLGVPHLQLFELSPLHDNYELLAYLKDLGETVVFFENKVLYAHKQVTAETLDAAFDLSYLGDDSVRPLSTLPARISCADARNPKILIITSGGCANLCLNAMKTMLVEHEVECTLLVTPQLYPLESSSWQTDVTAHPHIITVEEGTAGGSWGGEVASVLYKNYWSSLRARIHNLCSRPTVIPSSLNLERQVLVQEKDLIDNVLKILSIKS